MTSQRPAKYAAALLAGALAIALTACGDGSGSSTTTSTTMPSGMHAGKMTRGGKGLGPASGPGAPPATHTANPRPRHRHQGPPGSTMTSTYPGQIIGHGLARNGPVQPAELWPVTNGWRISDHRTFTAVYAGAAPGHRSTGRLVIFRQNFVKVTQTSKRVNVPGSGPVTITSAPQGRSHQTEAQVNGTLAFKGANGTTGTLHLSSDTVTVNSS